MVREAAESNMCVVDHRMLRQKDFDITKYISEGRSAFKVPEENGFDEDPEVDKEE